MERSSGILMPLSSLPSPYGIGTMGQAAYDFADFLDQSGQSWWQILPVGPTSIGDSPYQSPSAYAGNPYFIDLDILIEDGLLERGEVDRIDWGPDPEQVDYGLLYDNRIKLLRKAYDRGWKRDLNSVREFEEDNSTWLPDFSLFMALKSHYGMEPWINWPDEDVRFHKEEALARMRTELAEDIQFHVYMQYLFFLQWDHLRDYLHSRKIRIIGDIPLYVALDSADVWAEPEFFQLSEEHIPKDVSGVPPDRFSSGGQLWGNPLYDYDRMKEDGYGWWIRRIGGAAKLYDTIRIDHFRGLASYWAVPYGSENAMEGRWIIGPGMDLIGRLKEWFPEISFIAEDLGYPSQEVVDLLNASGFPGMKVLEFAFDSRDDSEYLPHSYERNSVCYIGTHDNETLMGWKGTVPRKDLEKAVRYLGVNDEEGFVWSFVRGGMSSVSDLFMIQMQDYLELGADSRMNTPGIVEGNWRWRMLPGQLTTELALRIRDLTALYGRSRRDG